MRNLEQDIAHMVAHPGVYILTDSAIPSHPITGSRLMSVVYVNDGKIISLAPDNELDPNKFFSTAEIHGPLLPS